MWWDYHKDKYENGIFIHILNQKLKKNSVQRILPHCYLLYNGEDVSYVDWGEVITELIQ